ncbi:LuxR C-terminal-related transcriptional regulator [soil metagenome]
MTATSVSGTWPLIGRDEEIRLIAETLNDGRDPGGVAITGRAGVGKTRLAREAAMAASAAGATVRWTAGTQSAQPIPLGAFAEWATGSGDGALELVGAVIEALSAAPNASHAVIVVDDAHLLDGLSAFVLHQVVLRKTASVIVTIRSGEPVPDAVTALWKDGYLRLLELQPLSCTESETLLCGALTGDLDPECARRIWESTGGNVLYLRHLVAQETAARRLVNTAGTWAWTGTPVMSPMLIDLIESQVGSVPEAVLEAVDLVAIAEPLNVRLLAALVKPSVVEDAEQRGLLAVTASGGTTLACVGHPLYGEIRRDRAAPSRLRRLRARVASELAKQAELDDADTVRLGVLWLDSDLAAEPQVLFNAAHAAFLRFDFDLAARLADASERAGGPADAALLGAQALALMNRVEESQEVLASLRDDALDDRQLAYSIALRACNLWAQLDRPSESWELLDTTLQAPSAVVRESCQALRALQLAMRARPTEALAMSERVSRDRLGDFQALIANWALVIALGGTGRIGELAPVAIEGYERARRSPEAAFLGVGLAEHHVKTLLLAGCVGDAVATAQAVCRRCVDAAGTSGAVGSAITAIAALGSGRLRAARNQLCSASAVFAARDAAAGVRYRFTMVEVEALAKLGDISAAAAALESLQPSKPPMFAILEPDLLLAGAWVEAARGAVSRAVAMARQAAEFARTHGELAREVMSLQTATHFGDTATATRLGELKDLVEGPRAPAAFEFAAGLAGGDGAMLQAASRRFEAMGDMFAAADASAHGAIAYRREGLRGAALTAAGRAQRIAHECGGAVSPALREAAQPLPLTPREKEIISLVAQGLSNRQIADAMCVSVRTVEGHLYRASLRSGTANRTELVALLGEYNA